MNVQRSHFRLYPSITLIVLFILTLAALLTLLFAGLFSLDGFGTGASHLKVLGAFLVIAAGFSLFLFRDIHIKPGIYSLRRL